MKQWKKEVLQIVVLVVLYVLLGNARSVQANPFIPGAKIAVNMIVPVVAGILFGRYPGFIVGIMGTTLNAISPAGSSFELMSILPHGVMGYVAGYLSGKLPSPMVAISLLVGHGLNLLVYTAFGMLPALTLMNSNFWFGVAYESFVGILTIIIITAIYRRAFEGVEWH